MDILDIAIIGGGPAGLTASIYAIRSGLKAVIFDKGIYGGQANQAPWIENYPGFDEISGMDLMDKMRAQAMKYVEIKDSENVESITKDDRNFIVKTSKEEYHFRSVIYATGSVHRRLGAPGEGRLLGKGVSYCATCDGFFFKDKKVAIIGGGNNAATEAIYLKKLGTDVTIVHRRDELRAEDSHKDTIVEMGINVVYDSVVEEILGENMVEGIRLKNVKTGDISDLNFNGVFISIGDIPQTELVKDMGVDIDDSGYIVVDKAQRTNIPHFYTAGDVSGGFRQIITACSEGAIAANSAHEDLAKPYWT
ncbi:MAG: thioredoxin-disulfide reductase [Thermoplasmata archaeon]|nr:thioredoxin-disulfide reductase [Thermoplasmata archaeon]